MQSLAKTVPSTEKNAFLEEVYGVITADAEGYFPERILNVVTRKAPVTLPIADTVYISIDPASHECSCVGLAAAIFERGRIIVVGSASVPVGSANVDDIGAAITDFTRKVVNTRGLDTAKVVPIIECNHSEIVARQILDTVRQAAPARITMPWTRSRYASNITDGVGVYTRHETKQTAVLLLRKMIQRNAVEVAQAFTTTSSAAFNPAHDIKTAEEAQEILWDQMSHFRNNSDGTISGKASGADDDAAWALLMLLVWADSLENT